jgi:hypothetical protein
MQRCFDKNPRVLEIAYTLKRKSIEDQSKGERMQPAMMYHRR